jgi:hypothetical protein
MVKSRRNEALEKPICAAESLLSRSGRPGAIRDQKALLRKIR